MVGDAAIHENGTGHNRHMHVRLTVARLKPDGFGPKIADVDAKSFVTQAPTGWEAIATNTLPQVGSTWPGQAKPFGPRHGQDAHGSPWSQSDGMAGEA
jgi:hypothetical protein